VSFIRHRKIYQFDGLKGKLDCTSNFPIDHRSDESSTGYSFMGCSPAEPMSASPVIHSFSLTPSAVKSTAVNRNLSPFMLSQPRGPLHVKGVPAKRKDSDYHHRQNAPYRHSFRAIRILSCHRRTSLKAVLNRCEWKLMEWRADRYLRLTS
jgi:hypothetical protein